MNPPSAYYAHIKAQRCLGCRTHGSHANPIEAAHIRAVLSPKTDHLMHRSHKGLPGWAAIPLCKKCHEDQHRKGEHKFIRMLGVRRVHRHLFTNLLTYVTQEMEQA